MKPARSAAVVSHLARRLRELERAAFERLLPRGVTMGDARVVRAVERVGLLGVSAIAAHLGTSQPAATVAIARVVAQGLVAQSAHATDGRRKVLILTSRGKQVDAAHGAVDAQIADGLLSALPKSARAAALELLERLAV